MSASSAVNPPLDPKPLPNHSNKQMPNSPRPPHSKPSRLKLTYDIVMVIAISIDLLFISIDAILMSNLSSSAASWLTLSDTLNWYRTVLHEPLRTAGGFFTLFLIVELLLRWAIAIKEQVYYRWFFFPFVHWYEVLGCFPQLRALRLFRVVIIGRRLHQLGYQVLPQPWLTRIKFYINLVLEELSDRVILTTIDSYRQQLTDPKMQKSLIDSTFTRNRNEIEATLLSLLRQELAPKLQQLNSHSENGKMLASDIGNAVQNALSNTPELHGLLRLIPIAGKLIEAQVLDIGHNIGENVVNALNECLLDPERIDALMVAIAQGVAQIDTNNTALETLIARIFSESLSEFESNLKIQQWKHEDLLNF
ncbi:RES family NAD+ phosphorylase [Psychrobacter urativorans]|uniref:Preprotein translocase subunit SecA n=1 Tax=Psychrobacter urativorans TaxID=45610 RepID=A0A0M4T742_9GAMM|nr:RES family NAD+ phosphorylase [Psychrobacter urativorans]ALF59409.1 hypothetical protein AOC03_04525 [Psychrobacter urativorans]